MNDRVYTAICGKDYPIRRNDITVYNGAAVFQNPIMDAKRYKVLPHLYCAQHPVTIWVDGNIWIKRDAQDLIDEYLGDADMALFRHPVRRYVWEEFATLRADRGRFRIPYLQQQLGDQERAYRSAGLPSKTLLYECNFMIRRNNAAVNRLMDAWWSEICRWQWRDQVSLPYVLWKYGQDVKLRPIPGPDIREHPDFKYVRHH